MSRRPVSNIEPGLPSHRLASRAGGSESSYIDNTAQCPDSVWPEDDVGAAAGILHYGTRDHDDVLCRAGQLLNDEVDHLTQAGILVLEELRDTEEEGRGFILGKLLASVEKKGDLGE